MVMVARAMGAEARGAKPGTTAAGAAPWRGASLCRSAGALSKAVVAELIEEATAKVAAEATAAAAAGQGEEAADTQLRSLWRAALAPPSRRRPASAPAATNEPTLPAGPNAAAVEDDVEKDPWITRTVTLARVAERPPPGPRLCYLCGRIRGLKGPTPCLMTAPRQPPPKKPTAHVQAPGAALFFFCFSFLLIRRIFGSASLHLHLKECRSKYRRAISRDLTAISRAHRDLTLISPRSHLNLGAISPRPPRDLTSVDPHQSPPSSPYVLSPPANLRELLLRLLLFRRERGAPPPPPPPGEYSYEASYRAYEQMACARWKTKPKSGGAIAAARRTSAEERVSTPAPAPAPTPARTLVHVRAPVPVPVSFPLSLHPFSFLFLYRRSAAKAPRATAAATTSGPARRRRGAAPPRSRRVRR